ncbi:LysM peptidoglycan-binding domain-containing protein [Trueperella sp. LYQ143]|uniref:LysM peptidoglycan-binding domain-containing protein n=1 Tax=unclassified Trueperella TaxID=2630174 RepID=UPI003983AD2B
MSALLQADDVYLPRGKRSAVGAATGKNVRSSSIIRPVSVAAGKNGDAGEAFAAKSAPIHSACSNAHRAVLLSVVPAPSSLDIDWAQQQHAVDDDSRSARIEFVEVSRRKSAAHYAPRGNKALLNAGAAAESTSAIHNRRGHQIENYLMAPRKDAASRATLRCSSARVRALSFSALCAAVLMLGVLVGMMLFNLVSPGISAGEMVTVGSGESLWSIANSIDADVAPEQVVADIAQLNGLESASVVAGQELILPAY